MKKEYEITCNGCDDFTRVRMELSQEEYELIKELCELVTQSSTYACEPTMKIAQAKKEVEVTDMYGNYLTIKTDQVISTDHMGWMVSIKTDIGVKKIRLKPGSFRNLVYELEKEKQNEHNI